MQSLILGACCRQRAEAAQRHGPLWTGGQQGQGCADTEVKPFPSGLWSISVPTTCIGKGV